MTTNHSQIKVTSDEANPNALFHKHFKNVLFKLTYLTIFYGVECVYFKFKPNS